MTIQQKNEQHIKLIVTRDDLLSMVKDQVQQDFKLTYVSAYCPTNPNVAGIDTVEFSLTFSDAKN